MSIGFKEKLTTSGDSSESPKESDKAVEDLSQALTKKKEAKEYKIEHDSNKKSSAKSKNNIIFAAVLASMFVLVIYAFITATSDTSVIDKSSETATINNDIDISTEDSNGVLDVSQADSNDTSEEITTESNSNAIYDDNGNIVSSNGIYDGDGNVISSDEDIIEPGLPNFSDSESNTTTATVYSASDYIKDLNGVDVSAVYNVKSRDYIKDFVNYEAKRAIIDDGMELYWLEVTYGSKKYRVQVPFYAFKDLDKTGICIVEIEVLTLEGGEKIISYMQIITDYSNLSN